MCILGMKKLALSTLLAIGGNNAQKSNSEIMEDQPAISDGIIFNQGGETHQVSYLDREFSEDDGEFIDCSVLLHPYTFVHNDHNSIHK